jgi:hypothetical protein
MIDAEEFILLKNLLFVMIDSDDDGGDNGNVCLAPSNDATDASADVVIISLPQPLALKKKRSRSKDPPSVPDTNGTLTIVVHIITTTAAGDFLTKSRKNYSFKTENAAAYLDNVDYNDATKNIALPTITGSTAHDLVINHFGQNANAANLLRRISSGNEPHLVQKLKASSNPECSVSFQSSINHFVATYF